MSETVQVEINKYITNQTNLFNAIKNNTDQIVQPDKIEYTTPAAVQTSAVLDANRLEQEKFLNQYQEQYNFITNLRQKYAAELEETNTVLSEQTIELSELETDKKKVATGATTEFRKLKNEKYDQAKQDYYYHLYLVCGLVQIIIVCVLAIASLGFISRGIALCVFLLGVIGLCTYVVYYIFFNSRTRDIMVYDKFKFPINGDGLSACPSAIDSKKNDSKNAELDAKIAGILTNSAGQCPNKLVPDASMPNLP